MLLDIELQIGKIAVAEEQIHQRVPKGQVGKKSGSFVKSGKPPKHEQRKATLRDGQDAGTREGRGIH